MLVCFAQEPSLQWGCLYGKLIGMQDCSWSDLPLPFWRLKVRTGIAASSLCRLARVGEVQARYCFPFFVLVQLLDSGDLVDIPMAAAHCKADPRKAAAWLRVSRGDYFKEKCIIFCLLLCLWGQINGCSFSHLLQVRTRDGWTRAGNL